MYDIVVEFLYNRQNFLLLCEMKNSYKGKHLLWSQILVGMIAIFLLPATQRIEAQSHSTQTYQNTQLVRPQPLFHVLQTSQRLPLLPKVQRQGRQAEKFPQITPHFYANCITFNPPIRAGPYV